MLREKDHFVQVVNSYMGLLKHTNSFHLRREILERIGVSAWGKVLEIDRKNWLKVVQKPNATTLAYYKRRNKKRKKGRLEECKSMFI